jgi:hypothetical protein
MLFKKGSKMTYKEWSETMNNKPILKPFDVVVIDGLWYMPHHWLIKWRTLDHGVHCVTVKNEAGEIWNPIFTGIESGAGQKHGLLDCYKGRTLSIHRFKGELDYEKMIAWGNTTAKDSKGYDFWSQWFFGFVCGLTTKASVNDEQRWTCAEFPYWGLTYNQYILTSQQEQLPMPRLFRYNDHFETIFSGVWE